MKSCRIEINGLEAFDVGANIEDALEIRIEKLQNSESFVLSVTSFSVGDTHTQDWGLHQLSENDVIQLCLGNSCTIKPTEYEPLKKESSLLVCSFCGKSRQEVTKLITGKDGAICNFCADTVYSIANE